MGHDDDFEEFDDRGEPFPLDERESAMVRADLRDLERFEEVFGAEGFRGVSIFCRDCVEEHFYTWEMMSENLRVLLDTGETPVHEPAFAPDPDDYIPWEYARGYADALSDVGVFERREMSRCPRCRLRLGGAHAQANFCPRCGAVLLHARLRAALESRGLDDDLVREVLREAGLPD
jgi:hypothetical protein